MLVYLAYMVWLAPRPSEAPPEVLETTEAIPREPVASRQDRAEETRSEPSIGGDPLDSVTTAEDPAIQQEAIAEETVTVQSTLFEAEFSNRGALISSWELADYVTPDGDPV
jgi:hypothetical protein